MQIIAEMNNKLNNTVLLYSMRTELSFLANTYVAYTYQMRPPFERTVRHSFSVSNETA